MREKENSALDCLQRWVARAEMPIVACSFGKDSLTLLHLARRVLPSIPVLFFYEDFQPEKTAFARQVIADWDLTVFSYPPTEMDVNAGSGEVELIRRQAIGGGCSFYMPIGTNPNFQLAPACGIAILQQPTCDDPPYFWDVTFIGHRTEDEDPVYGNLPLRAEAARAGDTQVVYPLRDWTKAEIWDYIERNKVPYNQARYDKAANYRERSDRRANNDYYDVCTRCFSPYEPATVVCPITGEEYENVSSRIDWQARRDRWRFVNIASRKQGI